MSRQILSTPAAPAAVGPYSQGVATQNLIFTSGQLGLDPATGVFAGPDVVSQARRALENTKAVLAAGGMTMDNVVKVVVFLTDMNDFAAVNAVYSEYFPKDFPARSCVQVGALPKGGLVEFEMIAQA